MKKSEKLMGMIEGYLSRVEAENIESNYNYDRAPDEVKAKAVRIGKYWAVIIGGDW